MTNATKDSMSSTEAVQAVLDHAAGNCFVLIGFYSDKSGAKLFGIYDDLWAAEDRKRLLDEAGAAYQTRVVKIRRNHADPQEIY
jgi:hypothetical protein